MTTILNNDLENYLQHIFSNKININSNKQEFNRIDEQCNAEENGIILKLYIFEQKKTFSLLFSQCKHLLPALFDV